MKSKRLLSVFTASAMLLSGVFSLNAYADDDMDYKITYSSKYTYLEITPSDDDHTIRYTIDGSAPDKDSTLYKGRLRTTGAVTIRAAEFNEKGKKIESVKINLKRKCSKVTAALYDTEDGYKMSLFTKSDGASIYYTTDGSKPTVKSELYEEPFEVEDGMTVRAVAVKNGWKKSTAVKIKVNTDKAVEAELGAVENDESYDESAERILEIINEERADRGLSPLKLDEKLCEAAEIRAKELPVLYSHTRPDESKWYTVFDEVDFCYAYAAENIAYTEGSLSTCEYVMEMWMNSKVHRENILNTSGSLIGIACYKKGNFTYWVQNFGEVR